MKYAQLSKSGLQLASPLGEGTDGAVWRSNRDTAIKSFERIGGYYNERDCYLRFREYGLTEKIDHFWVPRLIDFNDDLWVVEMEIVVNKPYIIDFAKIRIDRPPDFSEEVLRDQEARGQDLFGDHWPEVCQVMATLESYGIYYLDPQLGNIVFEDLVG